MTGAILRPGQVALLDQIDAAITDGCRRLIAQAPTGFGKTIVAADRLRLLQDAGRRAIFTVPALSLVDQTVEKLFAEGVTDVGVIQGSHRMTNPSRLIQVATPQSLHRRDIPDADEIIIDEVHIWFSKLYPKLLSDPRYANVPKIGLTATPSRRNRQALSRWRGQGRLQRRVPHHRSRLGCPVHHLGAADALGDALRPD